MVTANSPVVSSAPELRGYQDKGTINVSKVIKEEDSSSLIEVFSGTVNDKEGDTYKLEFK